MPHLPHPAPGNCSHPSSSLQDDMTGSLPSPISGSRWQSKIVEDCIPQSKRFKAEPNELRASSPTPHSAPLRVQDPDQEIRRLRSSNSESKLLNLYTRNERVIHCPLPEASIRQPVKLQSDTRMHGQDCVIFRLENSVPRFPCLYHTGKLHSRKLTVPPSTSSTRKSSACLSHLGQIWTRNTWLGLRHPSGSQARRHPHFIIRFN